MKNYDFEDADSENTVKKIKQPLNFKTIGKAIIDYMSGSVSPVITGLMAGGILKLFLYFATMLFSGIEEKLDIKNPIIRINTGFKGYSSTKKVTILPRIYHNWMGFDMTIKFYYKTLERVSFSKYQKAVNLEKDEPLKMWI